MIGQAIGPYQIVAKLGEGGMGEVYRATDTNLGRQVAIKVLPDTFTQDAERVARFEREAKTLASLNHPNIAQIYGFEKSDGLRALVMELVEGPTLADRIARGPIPVDEALPIAKQIAEGLEAAHEQSIVHRDLKPANIKLRSDGAVKVLDFGLAKALEPAGVASNLSDSPTITSPAMTHRGVILGTAAYMSPEQTRGKVVDKRSDIWAFGCVLYEMLTGRRAFEGDDISETLAAVLRGEPDWSLLPADTPSAVGRLLRRCLRKDARERLHDISDARIEMQDARAETLAGTTLQAATYARRRVVWAVGVMAIVITALAASAVYFRSARPEAPSMRFTIGPPNNGAFGVGPAFMALSPDGTRLAFEATGPSGTQQLWIRPVDSFEAQPVPGSERAAQVFWSADSRFLAFFADGSLKRIAVAGGPAQTVTSVEGFLGGTWSRNGIILFGVFQDPGGIRRVSAAGGAASPVTALDQSREELAHAWPQFLPDDRHFLFSARSRRPENDAIYVGAVDSEERTLLLSGSSNAVYVDIDPGYLLYQREGTLLAQAFDAERIQLIGEAVPIAENVQSVPPIMKAAFTASQNGVLAYRTGTAAATRTLVWVDRDGTEQPLAAPAGAYEYPRLSPDGGRIAVEIGDQIWLYDLAADKSSRLTFEEESENPVWAPDGKRIVFDSPTPPRAGQSTTWRIFWQMADGSGGLEQLTTSQYQQTTRSWSSDGRLLGLNQLHPETQRDIWVLRLSDRQAQPFLTTRFNEGAPHFSPDGRWLTYVSDESGRPEIYVLPYPGPGSKRQISADGGTEPTWSPSGRELFYRRGTIMMAVEVTTQPAFSAGKARMLFDRQYLATLFPQTFPRYDVSADGQRFLMMKPTEGPAQINIVQNWSEDLKRLVPTN